MRPFVTFLTSLVLLAAFAASAAAGTLDTIRTRGAMIIGYRADAAPFPLHRPQQITFDLLPTSVQFHAGDRIRIAIAAADPDSFQLLPANGQATYRITHSPTSPSYVDLPVIG